VKGQQRKRHRCVDAGDLKGNIDGGVAYLAQQMRRYGERSCTSISAEASSLGWSRTIG